MMTKAARAVIFIIFILLFLFCVQNYEKVIEMQRNHEKKETMSMA